MKRRMLIALVLLLALAAIPSVSAAGGPKGCLHGGKKFVGDVGLLDPDWAGLFANITWTYPSSACTGESLYAEGDSSVQIWKYPDGTWEHYIYVFTSEDLTDRGAFCEMDAETGGACVVTDGHLKYWLIHFSSNAGEFEVKATPPGRGFY